MESIELKNTLPQVFASRDSIESDVWHKEIALQKGKLYLLEANSGTGKSSFCSYIFGYRKDYQGIICFDGKNINNLTTSQWVDVRKNHISMLWQELRLFPELTAFDNVLIKNNLTGFQKKKQIDEWFEMLGIADKPAVRLHFCRRTDKPSRRPQQRDYGFNHDDRGKTSGCRRYRNKYWKAHGARL